MQIDTLDVIGLATGFFSILLAFYIFFSSSNSISQLKKDLEFTIREKESNNDYHEKTLESINEVAFSTLLRVKNFPNNAAGIASQRESFFSALDAISKITSAASKLSVLKGEFVFGGDLGAIENSPTCKEVIIFTPDLKPDIDEQDLLEVVVDNAKKGTKYAFVVPEDISNNVFELFDDLLESLYVKYETAKDNISVIRIERENARDVFEAGSCVLYLMSKDDKKIIGLSKIAFSEIVIPNEKRGALWRRLSDGDAQRFYDIRNIAFNKIKQ